MNDQGPHQDVNFSSPQQLNFTEDDREDVEQSVHEANDRDHEEMSDEELNRTIEQLCLSKAEEFRMLGYEHVTGEEIWACVSDGYTKKGVPLLHQIVNDILSLKVTRFMNWMTLQAYKQDDFYREFNKDQS